MSYLEDYPAGTVEGDILRDPVRMLRSLREQEAIVARQIGTILEMDALARQLAEALTTPVTRLDKARATSAAQRYRARKLYEAGWTKAKIARTLDCSWMTVYRYTQGMAPPRG